MTAVGTLTAVHRKYHIPLIVRDGLLISARTGIGPEVFSWKTADGHSVDTLTADQEEYYQVIPVSTSRALRHN